MDTRNVVELLDATIPIVRKAQEEWRDTAQGFNSVTLFDPKEVVQTRIIAGLLDPSGNHGQADIFLRLFLQEIGEKVPDWLGSTQVITEHRTASIEADRRRIDLLIILPTGRHIALESKARDAEDRPDQISAYLSHLENVASGNHVMIYLSLDGKPPRDIPKEWEAWTKIAPYRVQTYNYNELLNRWLSRCRLACSQNALSPLRLFLRDFANFSNAKDERSPLMTQEFTEKVAGEIARNKERLTAAVAVYNSWDGIRCLLAKRFIDALHKELKDTLSEDLEVTVPKGEDYRGHKEYLNLSLQYPSWKTFTVAFEIGPDEELDKHWYQTIGIGVTGGGAKADKHEVECGRRIRELLGEKFFAGSVTPYWATFRREFENMGFEQIAELLFDCPADEVKRIARTLIKIAETIRKKVDEFSAVQGK